MDDTLHDMGIVFHKAIKVGVTAVGFSVSDAFCSSLLGIPGADGAGIKAAAPGRTLQQIAAQLESMRERTPRGGRRWHPSSVKHLLSRTERLGMRAG